MKKIFFIIQLFLVIYFSNGYGQAVLFTEDFESEEIPLNWKEEFAKGSINWRYENGGYTLNPEIPYSRNPMAAHGGSFNALFQYQSLNSEATKLVTKRIDALEFAIKPELHFYHAQVRWKHGSDYYNDRLRVYYKSSSTGPWTLLTTYTEPTTDWVERIILLPDNHLSGDYYLAFEGETKWGYGTCVDDIQIIETGILQKYLSDISIEQTSDVSVSSGTTNNPVLRLKFKVMGNSGTCPINSLVVNSLNENDNDVATGGVKLFLTTSDEFNTDNQVGTGASFVSGQAVFSGLNHDLPIGYSYLWVTYDIKSDAGHRDSIDAKFMANSININGQTYFTGEQSPAGSRTIFQTQSSDDFESGLNWQLYGEFEHGAPQGLGGSQGNADPMAAYSGTKIIGTDLTGLGVYPGDYEKNLTQDEYMAISDTFDFTYYNDLSIRYMRFMNIGINDEAAIDVSRDGGKTWQEAWSNSNMILDNTWKLHEIDITSLAARKSKVLIRYTLGTTNDYWQLSGWNIDDFSITGNFVSKDVGISRVVSPVEGCGLSDNESVTVVVKNYGATESFGLIPLRYSFDGNETVALDTLYGVMPVGDSVLFTFKKKADLSVPGIYDFSVSTVMNGDDDLTNDGLQREFYAQTSIGQDFTEDFESEGGLWRPSSNANSNWEWGTPGFGIEPSSGIKLWMTRLISNYPDADSSFVESVCYANSENERKVLQLKYWYLTENGKDGVSIQYSVDNGSSWQILDTLNSGVNWYTGNVQSLNTRGWSGNSGEWKTSRVILPSQVTAAPVMKFRMVFESDADSSNIGFAFDDFRILKAPHDIGVSQINSHADACQYVNPDELTISIKNFGINTLKQNDTIIVGFDFNDENVTVDTFRLSADLKPGNTMLHTFSSPVDVSQPGNYSICAYTLLNEDPEYSFSENDSAKISFSVYPGPVTSLSDTIQTHQPDTVVLETILNADYDYWWNGVSGTNIYNVQDAGWHRLTVTATRGNGCTVYDSTNVELLFNDTGVEELVHPVDNCGLSKHEYPVVRVKNFGTDSIVSGQKIAVAYQLNSGIPVSDTLTLLSVLHSGQSIDFQFTKGPVDLSGKGIYNFRIYTSYSGDTIMLNDTIFRDVEILGRPAVSIGPDKTVQALSYTLDAGSGYESYHWDNGVTTRNRVITETGTYWVQVFDENQCDNYDTAYIRLKIRDISPDGLASPLSDCSFNAAEPVALRILNSGTDTVPSGTTVSVSYRFNGGSRVNGSVTLVAQLLPGSFVNHSFPGTVNLSNPADYSFEATAVMTGDIRTTNDTADLVVYRYNKPVIDFGLNSTEYVEDIEFQINAGSSPYLSYDWQDDYTGPVYTATTSGIYRVIATDTRTSCFDGDTVTVFLIYGDVGVTLTDMPLNGCTGEYDHVTVQVKNLGTTTIGKDAPIFVACDVDGIRVTLDTLVRSSNFAVNSTLDLVLSGKVKISEGGISNVAFYTIYNEDMKDDDDTLWIEFDALPGPVIDFGDINGSLNVELPHLLDAGAGHKSYLWQNGSVNPTYTVTQNGTYSVTVTGQNDCQTSKTVRINLPSGFGDNEKTMGEIMIYPNPSQGLFRISLGYEENRNLQVNIFNNQGQLVYSKELTYLEPELEFIDIQHLPRGIYHIVIYAEEKSYRGKIIIQ
ncbi:MAG: T9SS type A sorting domain-containing protein [Bacteroidales bacterium]|nr:T9SS type A sorting domain-containing protein [Bacteroidales bacterium]